MTNKDCPRWQRTGLLSIMHYVLSIVICLPAHSTLVNFAYQE
ncbi:MAG: hypothetical protein ACPG8W_13180 [Candidatus Promineifilaceae bacterium]